MRRPGQGPIPRRMICRNVERLGDVPRCTPTRSSTSTSRRWRTLRSSSVARFSVCLALPAWRLGTCSPMHASWASRHLNSDDLVSIRLTGSRFRGSAGAEAVVGRGRPFSERGYGRRQFSKRRTSAFGCRSRRWSTVAGDLTGVQSARSRGPSRPRCSCHELCLAGLAQRHIDDAGTSRPPRPTCAPRILPLWFSARRAMRPRSLVIGSVAGPQGRHHRQPDPQRLFRGRSPRAIACRRGRSACSSCR